MSSLTDGSMNISASTTVVLQSATCRVSGTLKARAEWELAARVLPGLTREGAAGARTSSPEEHLRRRSARGRLLAVPRRRVGLALQDLVRVGQLVTQGGRALAGELPGWRGGRAAQRPAPL